MNHSDRQLVTVKKCAELTGLSENAIRQYLKKGQWRFGIHWFKSANNKIFISMSATNLWMQGKEA
ncbi:MAG: MerR family transcriptional regulator [Nitrosomonadaceae bacterium]|nr:MerR family transcriptional regulator [Nitrosomonadaceae bacterium]